MIPSLQAGQKRPQNPPRANGNGARIRRDGFSDGAAPTGNAVGAAKGKERRCKLPSCGLAFTPRRPNQEYHSDNCRKVAYTLSRHALMDGKGGNGHGAGSFLHLSLVSAVELLEGLLHGHPWTAANSARLAALKKIGNYIDDYPSR